MRHRFVRRRWGWVDTNTKICWTASNCGVHSASRELRIWYALCFSSLEVGNDQLHWHFNNWLFCVACHRRVQWCLQCHGWSDCWRCDATTSTHDDVIKWKHFPRYWPFVRGIHRSPVTSPHKGQWRVALMLSFICAWINGWVNNCEAGDLRSHHAHYDVTVMYLGLAVQYKCVWCLSCRSVTHIGLVSFSMYWQWYVYLQ